MIFNKSILNIFILFVLIFSSCKEEKKENISDNNPSLEISALNEKIKNEPNKAAKAKYYLTLSDIYFVANKTSKTKEALEKSIILDPANTDALMKMAELYLYVQKHQESIDYINTVLKLDQYNAKAYFMKGMNYKEIGDTSKAISSMQTAVEQDPEYYAAYMQLGILHAAQKNPLAIDYYNNALKINSGSIEAHYGKAKFYQDIKEWKRAIIAYEELLQNDADNKYAHYNLGVIYLLDLKLYDSALKQFDEAIKSDPQYADAYKAKELCNQAMGKTRKTQ